MSVLSRIESRPFRVHRIFRATHTPSIVPPMASAATPPVATMAPAYILPAPSAARPLVNPAADNPAVPAAETAAAAPPSPAADPIIPPLAAPIISSCFITVKIGDSQSSIWVVLFIFEVKVTRLTEESLNLVCGVILSRELRSIRFHKSNTALAVFKVGDEH